ncbi:PhoX family phosphatase [soil metagenome]
MTSLQRRALLPILSTGPHGFRSNMTCLYRCGNACDHPEPNTSGNESMRQLVESTIARRSVLRTGAFGASALVVGRVMEPGAAAAADESTTMVSVSRSDFFPVQPNRRDSVTVPKGFGHHVVISWGDKVLADAPTFDVQNQTPEAAARQFGYNNDYVGVLPLTTTRALLVTNHEYTDENLMFPTGRYDEDTIRRIAMASHGMSVVEIRRDSKRSGAWRRVSVKRARYNRRVTVSTKMKLTGPAAGDPRLRTSADPTGTIVRGTLNNCAGGMTPWGTVLSGEENFNQYFEASGALDARYAASYARYGITGVGGRGWDQVDRRFDMSLEPHEPFRFGWIVEIDPYRPDSTPRKRTMLGRMKHEGANIAVADNGRVVAYMGDDERGDYIYKFVSRDRMDRSSTVSARRHNATLLDHGTLFVARFSGDGPYDNEYDGTGRWLKLTSDTESFVAGMSVADVLIETRLAADKVGPTRMDRPEDIETNPVNGKVYCALTNNSQRGTTFPADEANPLTTSMVRASFGAPLTPASGNRNGYVLELTEDDNRPTARDFAWNLMLVCGDPAAPETYFAGYPKEKVSPISCPDNVAFDPEGNLWVATDGNVLGSNDGLFRVPVRGAERGHVQQFLTVPIGAETCGPLISEDGRSVWAAVQHPGEIDGATFENQVSTWPHTHSFPRPSVIVSYKP